MADYETLHVCRLHMRDGAIHYKLNILKLTMAVDNIVFRIIKGAFQCHHRHHERGNKRPYQPKHSPSINDRLKAAILDLQMPCNHTNLKIYHLTLLPSNKLVGYQKSQVWTKIEITPSALGDFIIQHVSDFGNISYMASYNLLQSNYKQLW